MTDWYGGHDAVAQLRAGNDLLMPGTSAQTAAILAGLKNGQLATAQLDADVRRVLELVLKSPTFKGLPYSSQPALQADAATARQAAAESMVLLRNEGAALPLAAGQTLALFGNTSYNLIAGGTGSGDVNRAYTISIAQGLNRSGFSINEPFRQAYTNYLKAEIAKLPRKKGLLDPAPVIAEMSPDAAQVQQQAQAADVAIVTLGRSAGEGGNRKVTDDFALTARETALLQQVSPAFRAAGKKVVVVLNVGGVVETASWRGLADAILLAWQPGQEGGHAVADVLSGQVNPSGKLTSTFPMAYADIPYGADYPGKVRPGAAPATRFLSGQESENTYAEGIFVGYHYFNTFGQQPAYAFGHSLSYTSFGYGPLKLSAPALTGKVTASLTNTGKTAGREVVQLYVSAPKGKLTKPHSELQAFAKNALLAPGKAQTLTFTLTPTDLASYDSAASAWVTDAGAYGLQAAASSVDVRQRYTASDQTRGSRQKPAPAGSGRSGG